MNADEFRQAAIDIYGNKYNRLALLAREMGYSPAMLHLYQKGKFQVPATLATRITQRQKTELRKKMGELEHELKAVKIRFAAVNARPLV